MDQAKQTEIEAATFRRLLDHLGHRTDVQNIDLMGTTGFCRNCLADWYREAAAERDIEMDKGQSREIIYRMPYGDFKANYQTPASDAQLQRMAESVARNKT